MWKAWALKALAVRITEPMLKSCPQFSTATWNVVPAGVEVGDDRVVPPVAVPVHDVAPVTRGEQLLVLVVAPASSATGPATGRRPTSPAGSRRHW